MAAAVADGLARSTRLGIVHRDVKPANVLIGDDGVVRLSDFGIAVGLEDATSLTADDGVVGTLRYLAPGTTRRVAGDASHRRLGARHGPVRDADRGGRVPRDDPGGACRGRGRAGHAPGRADRCHVGGAGARARERPRRPIRGRRRDGDRAPSLPGVPAAAEVPPDPSAPTEVIALPVAASLSATAAAPPPITTPTPRAATGALARRRPAPPWVATPRRASPFGLPVPRPAPEALAQRPGHGRDRRRAHARARGRDGRRQSRRPGTGSGGSRRQRQPAAERDAQPASRGSRRIAARSRSRARATTRTRARGTATATTTETTEPRYPADRRRGQQDEVMGAGRSRMAGVGARTAVGLVSHGLRGPGSPVDGRFQRRPPPRPWPTSPGPTNAPSSSAIPSVEPTPSGTPGSAGLGTIGSTCCSSASIGAQGAKTRPART